MARPMDRVTDQLHDSCSRLWDAHRVERFEDLLPRRIAPPQLVTRPSVQRVGQPLGVADQRPHAVYEADVFNFLLANSAELGVASVLRFRGF